MATSVKMPHMGESVAEGTIAKWLKAEGEAVAKDEPLVEVTSDKVDYEIPAPAAGRLGRILVQEGRTVAVGAELAVIEETERAAAGPPAPEPEAVLAESLAGAEPVRVEPAAPAPRPLSPVRRGERKITPVVARLAEQHGLDVAGIEGTGVGGRVTKQDLLAHLEGARPASAEAPPVAREARPSPAAPPGPAEPAPAPRPTERPPARAPAREAPPDEPVEAVPLTGMRRAIAEHMAESVRTAAHVTTVAEVDLTRLVAFRERHKKEFEEQEGFSLTYLPFIVRATVTALKEYPGLNASLEGDHLLLKKYYHIGIAVALDWGLIVPVIRHADRLDIRGLARAIHDLAERARTRQLVAEETRRGTFSITNPGVYGAVLSTPIIHQPQAAILGVEAIRKTPAVRDEQIVIRSLMYLCLSYDHRIVDGATAVQFLQAIRRRLESPLELIL
jgi:2-oxoglutarate dehydrogenase E2 component (dihydrolipoamide succinyltransferase)